MKKASRGSLFLRLLFLEQDRPQSIYTKPSIVFVTRAHRSPFNYL